tara:strand:+ start:193 stop:3645 length:3453 start_codon:yes stop_codon:yes gene_type:complete
MPTATGSLAFLGAARFQGTWNAANNRANGSGLSGAPSGAIVGLFLTGTSTTNGGYAHAHNTITASAGDYWQVTGSGTHNVDGNTSWALNDFCIYSGSAGGTGDWIKLAFEDTIASVVLGDLSATSFHIGSALNDKHVIFAKSAAHSGSKNFTFDYTNSRVGVGTSSPAKNLHVNGASGEVEFRIQSSNKFSSIVQKDNAELIIQNASAGDIIFYDDSAERMRIKDGGNVGIGTAAPLNTLSVTGTLAVSGDTKLSGDVNVADDKKLQFGNANDAHIEYDENGQDVLIISGSLVGGLALSGSKLILAHHTVASGTIAGPGSYLAVKSTGQVVLAESTGKISAVANGANNRVATFGSADSLNGEIGLQFDGSTLDVAGDIELPDDKKVIFGTNSDAHIEYNENGDDFLIVSGSSKGVVLSGSSVVVDGIGAFKNDLSVVDDKKVIFGTNSDGHIEYDENGGDFLVVSGSSRGIALSGTQVVIDNTSTVINGATTFNDNMTLVDDKRLIFGNNTDAYIEYNEAGDNYLTISGSSAGLMVSGSVVLKGTNTLQDDTTVVDNKKIIFGTDDDSEIKFSTSSDALILTASKGVEIKGDDLIATTRLLTIDSSKLNWNGETSNSVLDVTGAVEVSTNINVGGNIQHLADTHTRMAFTDNKMDLTAGGHTMLALDGDATQKLLKVGSNTSDIDIGLYKTALSAPNTTEAVMYISGSSGVIHFNQPIVVKDDIKLNFGLDSDASIEYNENGDDFLIVSGSSKGVALSGSVIALDGNTNVAGTFIADAGISGIHQLTGSLQLTGSDGVSLKLKSTGSVSIRLEADSDNNNEAQNPFIEFVQDGTATDFTVGLNKIGLSPDGLNIFKASDNTLMLGANQAPTVAATGHIQFYTRQTASFSLMDRGSTNHGTPVDREGFRVGIGPSFNEGNFPKGRVEIHNTADSIVPALYLAVSGTARQALVVDTKNTTTNIVEITGSSLTTGNMMVLYSNSSNTSERSMLKITNDNASSEKTVLVELDQDAPGFPALIQRGGGTVLNPPLFQTSLTAGQTIAAASLIDGTYFAINRNAGQTDTTATSAQIVAMVKGATVGDFFKFTYFNASSNDVTLAGGTNVKMVNTAAASFSIAAGKGRIFALVLNNVGGGSEQVNMIPLTDVFNLNS